MNDSILESYLVPCDELKAEDFKSSSVVIFQGERLPTTFSIDCITKLLIDLQYPWLFVANEKLKTKFYIAIGFEENTNIPSYTTNILCTFIKNKVFIENIYKCSKSSLKLRKICIKHQKQIQLDLQALEQINENDVQIPELNEINEITETIENGIDSTEKSINEDESNDKDVNNSSFIPDSLPFLETVSSTPNLPQKWTENLPVFSWNLPIKEYGITQTEIERKIGLFNDALLVENSSPLKVFQNVAQERLMFAPHASHNFLDRIVKHESIFDTDEDSPY